MLVRITAACSRTAQLTTSDVYAKIRSHVLSRASSHCTLLSTVLRSRQTITRQYFRACAYISAKSTPRETSIVCRSIGTKVECYVQSRDERLNRFGTIVRPVERHIDNVVDSVLTARTDRLRCSRGNNTRRHIMKQRPAVSYITVVT